MARRTTKAGEPVDEQAKRFIHGLNELLSEADFSHTISMGFRTAVVRKYSEDGKPEYRTTLIQSGTPFRLKVLYFGTTGRLLFRFVPLDAQDYVEVEFKRNDVFSLFPGLENALVGIGMELAPADKHKDIATFADLQRVVGGSIKKELQAEIAAEVKAKNSTNPLWGMF